MPIGGASLDASNPLMPLLRGDVKADRDATALTSADEAMTWRELDDVSAVLAASYRDLGLRPGDRIASLMPNRVGLAVHYVAYFKAGLVVTPLNYRYATPEIDHALTVSGPPRSFTTENDPTMWRRAAPRSSFGSARSRTGRPPGTDRLSRR